MYQKMHLNLKNSKTVKIQNLKHIYECVDVRIKYELMILFFMNMTTAVEIMYFHALLHIVKYFQI